MRGSCGVGAGGRAGGAAFAPATLTLQGWWRASFSASPWVGVASNGGSGSRNLTEATNPPSAGSALNGLNPADFDGSNDRLGSSDAMDQFVTSSAGMFAVLFNADAAAADAGATLAYNNPSFIAHNVTAEVYFTFSDSGGRLGCYNGSDQNSFAAACGTAAWHMAVGTWDSSTLYLSIDGGSFTTLSRTMSLSAAGALATGRDYDSTAFFNGRIAELMAGAFTATAGTVSNLRNYFNSRYALSL